MIFSRKKDMKTRVGSLVERIKESTGDNWIVLLDTGAIIDFEREVAQFKLKNPKLSTVDFYKSLFDELGSLYVNDSVLKEVAAHNERHFINGSPEISLATFMAIAKMRKMYDDLIGIGNPSLDLEKAKYDTYWASKYSFEEGHKKQAKDPISHVDRETIASALYLKNLFLPTLESDSQYKIVSGVAILSPDSHIAKTVEVLLGENFDAMERLKDFTANNKDWRFGYNGIKVINSR